MKSSLAGRPVNNKAALGARLRRLALLGGLVLAGLYVAGVTAGYVWLTRVRKLDRVQVADVALFRVQNVRRAMAARQFAQAQVEWDAKNFQAAYVAFATAMRQDPDDIPGRLKAVEFFRAVGAAFLGETALEEGLARAPGEFRLVQPLFELLLGTGREERALDLLHKNYAAGFTGPNQLLLQTYELSATLAVHQAPAARKLLDRHPELLTHPPAAPMVSRVLWESAERLKAMAMLADYLRTPSATLADYARLAGWQSASGQPEDAVKTAQQACGRFPAELPARVLLVEMQTAANPDGRPAARDIEAYLRNYSGRPEAIPLLASLAGVKGWVDLARALYDLGATRQANLDLLALYYCDALARNNRFAEVESLLAQVESQTLEAGPAFLIQLRQRQVIAAAALGQSQLVRDFARRLGAAVGNDPVSVDACRRVFQKLNIADAVAELTPRPAAARAPARL